MKWLLRIAVWTAGGLTLGVCGLAFWVKRFGRTPHALPRREVAVLFGAKVLPGGIPSGSLRARVERAAALYEDGIAARLLLSGGPAGAEPTEAAVALRLLVAAGVPREACILEEQSASTSENARFCAALLRPLGVREALVVTDPFHALRACRALEREGIAAVAAPASYDGRGLSAFERGYWVLREAFALAARPRLLFGLGKAVP